MTYVLLVLQSLSSLPLNDMPVASSSTEIDPAAVISVPVHVTDSSLEDEVFSIVDTECPTASTPVAGSSVSGLAGRGMYP